jgi:V-type H+-transporting ATPase subunit E
MIKLMENEITIRCRKEDAALVKSLLSECQKEFSEIMLAETKTEYKTTLSVLEGSWLTTEEGGDCGGIVLASKDRRIVCINTLQSRLGLCFEELLPQIRATLFPPSE